MRLKTITRLGVVASLLLSLDAAAFSSGQTGYSGHPSDGATCSSCHYGGAEAALNCGATSPVGSFNYSGSISASTSVLRGSSNSITYNMTRNSGTLIGLGGMGARINSGSFSGGSTVNIFNSSGNNTATHNSSSNTPSGGNISWTWTWDAPTSGFGSHTLYVCGNPTNNDGNCLGDGPHVNTCTSHTFNVVNSNPVANNDGSGGAPFLTVSEDAGSTTTGDVETNDSDADSGVGDVPAVNNFTQPSGGTVTHNGNGTFQYTPGAGFQSGKSGFSNDNFTYRVNDGSGGLSGYATVFVRVTHSDDPPVANNDGNSGTGFVTVIEGMSVSSGGASVLDNDSDPDDVETAVRNATCGASLGPTYGSVTLNSNGTFTYTHNGSDVATKDTFQYCAVGGSVYSSPVTVFVDITLQNDPPAANNFGGASGITFIEQTAVNIAAGGSLNFTDNDSTLLNQVIVEISGNYDMGQDSLACTALPGGINCGAFNASTGQIILSGGSSGGAASLDDYETAVEGVQFLHSSNNPDTNQRGITITLRDDANQSSSPAVRTYSNPITGINDGPSLGAISNIGNGEEGQLISVDLSGLASDPDDSVASLNWAITSGATGNMMVSGAGLFTWTPPLDPPGPTTFNQTYNVTIELSDSGADGALPDTSSFTITVDPPDGDSDLVADYDDLCVSVPSVVNGENLDNDNDGVPGTDGTVSTGGDVCDDDDDNDMILDVDELAYSLDPFDPTDATEDNDGDGINNRDEINNGTNPNSVNLIIDATGYFTPFELPTPDPKEFHPDATVLTANDYGPYRPGDNTITWTPSNATVDDLTQPPHDAQLVSNPPEQVFLVRPLLNFAADQIAAEGSTVNVEIALNGEAPAYPITVRYSISGSASGADYSTPMPLSGALVFNDSSPQNISFNLAQGDGADAGETIVFKITKIVEDFAVIGANNKHTVTIVEDNIAPQARLRFSQGGNPVSSAVAGTAVDVAVIVEDVNVATVVPGVTHTYGWSETDNSLVAFATNDSWTTPVLGEGNYPIEVVVRDQGSPRESVRVRRVLNVVAAAPTLLNVNDTDGDGSDDLAEGFDDSDEDGIPDYLDALDGNASLVDDQTVDLANRHWLQTEAGLELRIGGTAQAAASYGALITDEQVENFGSPTGGAVRNADDDFEHFVGVYDFTVSGMQPGSSAMVVIPLQVGIPRDAQFRKFDHEDGWGPFVEDDKNRLYSARGELGACPEPGSDLYQRGLNYLYNCLQMLVEDGGPNDSDKRVNGEYADPGTLGARLTEPVLFEEVEDGGGQMSLLLMTLLALLGIVPGLRRRRFVRG